MLIDIGDARWSVADRSRRAGVGTLRIYENDLAGGLGDEARR